MKKWLPAKNNFSQVWFQFRERWLPLPPRTKLSSIVRRHYLPFPGLTIAWLTSCDHVTKPVLPVTKTTKKFPKGKRKLTKNTKKQNLKPEVDFRFGNWFTFFSSLNFFQPIKLTKSQKMNHFSKGILWYTLLFPTDNWNQTKQCLGNSWLESKKVL